MSVIKKATGFRPRIWTCYKTVAPATFGGGATSYTANGTTPTLLIRKASGKKVTRPLRLDMSQNGTVAGGIINIIIKTDAVDRYSSGGTLWKLGSKVREDLAAVAPEFTVYSEPTATSEAAVGADPRTIFEGTLFQTVTASGTAFVYDFSEEDILTVTGSILIYTYAAVTTPTWSGTLTVRED